LEKRVALPIDESTISKAIGYNDVIDAAIADAPPLRWQHVCL